jgi:hypothetical protein
MTPTRLSVSQYVLRGVHVIDGRSRFSDKGQIEARTTAVSNSSGDQPGRGIHMDVQKSRPASIRRWGIVVLISTVAVMSQSTVKRRRLTSSLGPGYSHPQKTFSPRSSNRRSFALLRQRVATMPAGNR